MGTAVPGIVVFISLFKQFHYQLNFPFSVIVRSVAVVLASIMLRAWWCQLKMFWEYFFVVGQLYPTLFLKFHDHVPAFGDGNYVGACFVNGVHVSVLSTQF